MRIIIKKYVGWQGMTSLSLTIGQTPPMSPFLVFFSKDAWKTRLGPMVGLAQQAVNN
jgi:hypothetical protein